LTNKGLLTYLLTYDYDTGLYSEELTKCFDSS